MEIAEKSKKSLEFDKILEKLSGFAKLKQSKKLCIELGGVSEFADINRALNLTEEAKNLLDFAKELPVDFVAEIEKIENSTINSYLSEEEIVDVAKTIRTYRVIKNFLKTNLKDESKLLILGENLYSNKELEDKIFDSFDSSLKIKPDATPELKGLFNSLKDTEVNLKTRVNELLNNPSFSKHLQEMIYTTRDDRVVFQVRASSKSKIEGIVHDVSATNQTFYIEPKQLVSLNNKIREIKSNINSEIIRILTDLTKLIRKDIEEIKTSENIVSEIDFHFAKARYAVKLKAIKPELKQDKTIKIDAMRHPLLAEYVENVVENDFLIGSDYKSIIITGSNTGGKTVAIKTIGLFLLMTKSGLFLPCQEAKIYPFKNIFADIGDEQSIAQSLSTFSSHMTNIIDIIEKSDDEIFVIIDEICAGTDPQEGAILAQVILEELAKKQVTSCITTHYGELKALEFSDPYFKNACVDFNSETLKPTYKLIIGIPGLSNAISISSSLGLKKELTDKAKNILVSQKDPTIVVVEKLQETQQELSKNLTESEITKVENTNIKKELEKELSDVKKDKKRVIKSMKASLEKELEEVKNEIKDILDEMRKEKSEKIARRSYARLAKLEKNYRDDLKNFDESEKYEELNWENIKEGDKVMLKDLLQDVTILSKPDKTGNVFVQMGLIKTKINKNKLAVYDSKKANKTIKRFTPKETFNLKRVDMSNTLDLRGYRMEEALDSLEFFLDKASLANLTPVYVIHGHGGGVLKNSIGSFLETSPYVAKYRFGEPAEGGDGVRVIDIN